MVVVPGTLERLVERGHQLRGLDRCGLLGFRAERAFSVAREECQGIRVVSQLLNRELSDGICLGVQIEQPEAAEVAGQHPPRNLRVGKIVDVVERLLFGRDEILTR